jgi:hypothetical protein
MSHNGFNIIVDSVLVVLGDQLPKTSLGLRNLDGSEVERGSPLETNLDISSCRIFGFVPKIPRFSKLCQDTKKSKASSYSDLTLLDAVIRSINLTSPEHPQNVSSGSDHQVWPTML